MGFTTNALFLIIASYAIVFTNTGLAQPPQQAQVEPHALIEHFKAVLPALQKDDALFVLSHLYNLHEDYGMDKRPLEVYLAQVDQTMIYNLISLYTDAETRDFILHWKNTAEELEWNLVRDPQSFFSLRSQNDDPDNIEPDNMDQDNMDQDTIHQDNIHQGSIHQGRPYASHPVETLFIGQIREAIRSKNVDPGERIKALVNGSGLCDMFEHTLEGSQKIRRNFRFIRLSKLGFLVSQFQFSQVKKLRLLRTLKQMSVVCDNFAVYPLTHERRKLLFASLLDNQSQQHIWQREHSYDALGSSGVCQRLLAAEQQQQTLAVRFKLLETQNIFLNECLIDLISETVKNYESNRALEPFRAVLIHRWLLRIHQFVLAHVDFGPVTATASFEGILAAYRASVSALHGAQGELVETGARQVQGDTLSPRFVAFLKNIVDELPAKDAQDALETGEGFCAYFNTVVFDERGIGEMLYGLIGIWTVDHRMQMLFIDYSFNERKFFRLLYLQLICNHLRADHMLRQSKKRRNNNDDDDNHNHDNENNARLEKRMRLTSESSATSLK